jgi:4-hydroxyphenylpyruvate dioxygenase
MSTSLPASANPMGLDGFEFVEFAAPDPTVLERAFTLLGFEAVAKHRSKDVTLYRQGGINFILNREPHSQPGYFAEEHGAGACGMAFRVRNAQHAYSRALQLGAQPIDMPTGPMELRLPAIRAIGGAALYLIDRYGEGVSIYDIDFEWLPGMARAPRTTCTAVAWRTGPRSTSASSTSARSATSTSTARTPGCSRAP